MIEQLKRIADFLQSIDGRLRDLIIFDDNETGYLRVGTLPDMDEPPATVQSCLGEIKDELEHIRRSIDTFPAP